MRRLAWLTALALVMSCGGDPAPSDVENPATVKRKKKKKKKKKRDTEVADASDAPKKKKKSEDPEEKRRRQDEEDAREAEERRERIRKREAEEAKAEEEAQAVESDEGGDSSEDEEAKAEEKKAAADEKKRKKQEAAEKRRLAAEQKKAAAEEKKRKKEEEAEAKKEAEAEKKKKKKGREEVEEESSDDEGVAAEDDEEEESKKDDTKSKKDKGKAKKTVAAKEKKKDTRKKKDESDEEDDKEQDSEDEKEVAEADIDMEDEGSGLPPPDPENESSELDLEGGAPERDTGEEDAGPTYTPEIDRRPLTQPKGKLDVHGGLRVAAAPALNAMGMSETATSEALGFGLTYGVSSKLQVGLDYTVGIHPGSVKGPFAIGAAYRVKESEKFDLALSGAFAIDFIPSFDMATMMATTNTVKALQFGFWARYHLNAKASVFTGLPALPSSSGSLAGAAGLPPLPYHLSLGLGTGSSIALEAPVGLGYQASPKLYALAMTSLAHIDMKNSTGAFIFADYIAFSAGAFYAKDAKLDIGAVLSDDLLHAADVLRFDIVARYYLK